ncbi:hypothetical protein [Oceanobacillus manasiensis]|uniref:hypothetical protein n=1 Tax=Oceanobacillus manasiensis TaxID=586413 RepID=UPI0005A77A6D|nr:hypothetical protein [Oceanobacillus manasiensis]
MRKKLRNLGYVLFMSGTVLFGIMHLAIALYIPNLGGWSDPPGLMVTTLSDIAGWVPYTLSIVFMIIGAFLIVMDLSNNYSWWQNQNVETNEGTQELGAEQNKEG